MKREFRKYQHLERFGTTEVERKNLIEQDIVDKYVTLALCEKVKAKLENEGGFTSKDTPKLLNIVYYDLVREDCWSFIKEFKSPTINFKTLQYLVFMEVKNKMGI